MGVLTFARCEGTTVGTIDEGPTFGLTTESDSVFFCRLLPLVLGGVTWVATGVAVVDGAS